jgi:hypothetical protein
MFNWLPVVLCLAGVAALFAYMVVIRHPWPKTLGLTGVLTTLVFTFFGVIHLYCHHIHHTARHAFLRKHPDWAADALAATLAAEWRRTLRVPCAATLRTLLPPAAACRVIFFGVAEPPKFEPAPDEPMIETPTDRAFPWLLYGGTSLVVPFGIWALTQVGFIRLASTTVDGKLLSAGLVTGVIALLWAWRAGVRPIYIRLAPRMVQFLHYTMRSQPPTIHSYPAASGTVVCVEIRGRLTFLSADNCDTWNSAPSAAGEPSLATVLACLHAQRPTPPLSEDELIG